MRIEVRAGRRSTMLGCTGSQFGQEMEEEDAIKEEETRPTSTLNIIHSLRNK